MQNDQITNKKIIASSEMVEIKDDFYWDVHSEELYNPYEQPKQLTLGQLFDDLKEINRLNKHPDDAISYALNRISNFLKAISFENPLAF